jgi:hypothetical protein
MSTTRTRPEGADRAPESYLSSPQLAGININLSIIAQTARIAPERQRHAMLWLGNLAANWPRISLVWERRGMLPPIAAIGRMTADALAGELGLQVRDVREALTDPGYDHALFTPAVEKLRARFEAALPPLAETEPKRIVDQAFAYLGRMKKLGGVEGKWRAGKTESAEDCWLRNLHNTLWIDTPSDTPERSLVARVGAALGIGVGSGTKNCVIREKVPGALGRGLIERIIFDEAHFLMPPEPDMKPVRLEWVRELCGIRSVSAMLLVTKQFADAMQKAMAVNTTWAPGQLIGRMPYWELPDALSDEDIGAIVKTHAPKASEPAVRAFVAFAKSSEGYVGAMVNAIQLAIDAGGADGITNTAAAAAIEQQKKLNRFAALAVLRAPRGRGKRKVLTLEGRAA